MLKFQVAAYERQVEYIKVRIEDLVDAIAVNDWTNAELRATDILRLATELGNNQ